jgi:hypothetical protein
LIDTREWDNRQGRQERQGGAEVHHQDSETRAIDTRQSDIVNVEVFSKAALKK